MKNTTSVTPAKETLFKTARARLSCAHFQAGEIVSIQHYGINEGQHWFLITATEKGKIEHPVAYPMKHLTDFVI